MRKKALLAGAVSSFEGPWVSLEAGEWLVEPSPDVNFLDADKVMITRDDGGMTIRGPARIRAIVSPDYNGPGIFLSAKQISTNGAG